MGGHVHTTTSGGYQTIDVVPQTYVLLPPPKTPTLLLHHEEQKSRSTRRKTGYSWVQTFYTTDVAHARLRNYPKHIYTAIFCFTVTSDICLAYRAVHLG